MPEETKIRHSHRRLWIGLAVGVVLLAIFVGLAWYAQSPAFEDLVRRKVIAALEDTTGGRVELRSFHWNLSKLEFEADDLTIHGHEGAGQLPYAYADRIVVRLRVISILRTSVYLKYVGLERPVIHLIVNPDGTTNAPEPKVKQGNAGPVQQLFDLAVSRADLRNGMVLVNDHETPLDFTADDVDVEMTFDRSLHRYDGSLRVGRIDAKYQDFRDVTAAGEMEFALLRDGAEIKQLKLTSQKSSLEVQGKLSNFEYPKAEFTYNTTLDLGQLAAIARTYELRAGTLTSNGSGNYSETAQRVRGKLAARGVDYLQEGVALRGASASADYAFENRRLALTHIAGRLLGGEIAGEATIDNPMSSRPGAVAAPPARPLSHGRREQAATVLQQGASPVTAKISGPGPQHGVARLRISGFSLAELTRMISTRAMPLDALKPAGAVAGTVTMAWTGSLSDAEGELALDIAAPARAVDAELPISGALRGHYHARSQQIELATLDLKTPHSELNAAGTVGRTAENLKVSFAATSLRDFEPLVLAFNHAALPVELDGAANFTGTVTGKMSDTQIAGHLQASNFTYIYTPPANVTEKPARPPSKQKFFLQRSSVPSPAPPSPSPPRRIHVDELAGDVQYSPSQLSVHHAVIREGGATINAELAVSLVKGSFTEDSPFQIQLAVHNAGLTELQQAAGFDYPLTGVLNATLHASGTERNPTGQGQVTVTAAQAYGRPVKSAGADIAFANHEAQLDHLRVQAAGGVVAGSAAYNLTTKAVRFDLNGSSLNLAQISELQNARMQVAGVVKFTAKGSGTLDQPVINGHLEVTNLVLNGEAVGGLTADALTHGRELQLSARSTFAKASFTLDGTVQLTGNMPGNLKMQFSNLDIDPFLRAEIRGKITRQSSLAGQASLSGPLKEPQLLNGDFRINEFKVEVERVAIASDGPIELRLANGVVAVQRCGLVSENSRLSLSGSVSFKDNRPLSLRVDGGVDLKLVHTLNPDVTAYGNVNLGVTVTGTMSSPLMNGRIDIVHVGLSMIDLPAGLGDMNGAFVFSQDRLQVDHLTARMGGGLVTFSGFVTYGRTVGFDLTTTGSEIRFRYAGISVTSDQSLHLIGTLQSSTLSGDVTVTRFAQIPSTDLAFALAQASQPSPVPNPNSPLNGLRLDVRILSVPELTVQTSMAKLSGGVDLRLRGTAARPVLLGRINVAEGDLKIEGTKYHLERGDITFIDPVRIDPILDVEATTRVRDYDITVGLHGTLERLTTTYRSDPPLSSEDIVGLLAFGRTATDTTGTATPQFGFAESASNAVLGQALNSTVSNRMSRLFGVSSIRINPAVGGPDNNPNARLTVEQQVSNNVTLTYITNLTRSAQQVIQFEYNINSEYTLQGIRDENGVVSFDLLIRKRKR